MSNKDKVNKENPEGQVPDKEKDGTSQRTNNRRHGNNNKKKEKASSGRHNNAKGSFNDPSWYIPTDQILKDVASFPTNYPLGNATPSDIGPAADIYNPRSDVSSDTLAPGTRVPGILSFKLMPQIGMASDPTAAVNIAATNLYAYMRHQNSGAKNYDAPDMIQMIIAVAQAYSAMTWLQRIYGYANTFSSMNRYIPKALISANGVDPESIYANLADFRARINTLSLKLNAIYAPNTIKLFNRWVFIYSNCYTDSNTARAQIFQYVPYGFLQRDDTTGILSLKRIPAERMSYIQACTFVEEMINSLLYSEDVGIISGDILKAWGSKVYSMSYLPDNYSLIPSNSDEIRSQLENVSIVPLTEASTYTIEQDTDKAYIKTKINLIMEGYDMVHNGGKWINFHKQNVTPEDIIVATRLTPGISGGIVLDTNTHKWKVGLTSVGSELCVDATITYFDSYGYIEHQPFRTAYVNKSHKSNLDAWSAEETDILAHTMLLSAFDWAPAVDIYQYKSSVVSLSALDLY